MNDLYDFHMRVVPLDRSGYYYVNWDNATPLVVRAETRDDAFTKAWAVMGPCRKGRDWTWTAKVDKVAPAPALTPGATS